MNKILYDVLNDVSEGIIILNENLEISLFNNYMERITGFPKEEVLNNNIYDILPKINVNYFSNAIKNVIDNDSKIFFSAAMHQGLINSKYNLNLKISRFIENESKYLLLEFIDVTNQFIQINALKEYVHELCKVNKKLKQKEKIIKNLAYYDNLTKVANRTLFFELAEKFLINAKRNNHMLGVMFIDVDNLKTINDTYGHEAGDLVLVKVAEILKETTRKNDIVARHGGDEFLILLPYIKTLDNNDVIVSRIADKNKTVKFNDIDINISLSIGIGFFPYDGDTIDKLIAKADRAMYDDKKRKVMDCSNCSSCNI